MFWMIPSMIIVITVYMEVSQCKENKAESVQLLSSAKLILKQLITRVKVSEHSSIASLSV